MRKILPDALQKPLAWTIECFVGAQTWEQGLPSPSAESLLISRNHEHLEQEKLLGNTLNTVPNESRNNLCQILYIKEIKSQDQFYK